MEISEGVICLGVICLACGGYISDIERHHFKKKINYLGQIEIPHFASWRIQSKSTGSNSNFSVTSIFEQVEQGEGNNWINNWIKRLYKEAR